MNDSESFDHGLPDKLVIRRLSPPDSLDELTDLLHRSYKALANMGLKFLATHQDVETTRKRVQSGDCFVAELEGHLVGTITFYPPSGKSACEYYNRTGVGHLGQLAVEPSLQRRGIATALFDHAERHGASLGFAEIALDTAEPAEHLIAWYKRRGYKFVMHQQWEVTNYRSVIMSRNLWQAPKGICPTEP